MDFTKYTDKTTQIRTYKKGSTILYQGEVPRHAFIIATGQVKVYSISTSGSEQVVTFHMNGEFFPSSWIFEKSPSSLFFYEAITDCKIVLFDRSQLIKNIFSSEAGAQEITDYLSTNFTASLLRINGLQQSTAREKIIYSIYYLCQRYRYSDKTPGKIIDIPIKLTHQQIAAFVGLTRETTAMEISKLKKQSVLKYQAGLYRVDVVKLLEIIGEDSFKELKITDQA